MDRVLLLSLPWATPLEPSLGVSLLKAVYQEAGVPCDVYETQLELYRWVTHSTYIELARTWAITDFMFTGAFEEEPSARQLELALEICGGYDLRGPGAPPVAGPSTEERYEIVLEMRRKVVPRFLDAILENLDLSRYALIGFTCLFDQTFASLALAKRIRELRPDVMLAFGGYALQAPVGPHLQEVFPELMTAVAYGDGEPVALPLLQAARGELPLSEVPNISYVDAEGEVAYTDSRLWDLNQTPAPDFDDFFRQRDRLAREHKIRVRVPTLPLESSRGCWWGQKSHCVFCGIDDVTMRYRERLPERVIRDMKQLHQRYGAANFRFSDYILPHRYYQTLLPELARMAGPYRLQYEAKANMKQEHFDGLKEAGV
ncbi:MAG: RiPP maturation radical SAM C-methyltransferase, partial [Holophagales bacterium]|nr:RiPP maturation radical SAM C-methyltransferase [Holophagales bacterium]